MKYELAPVVLFTEDQSRMLGLLSDVFEFELNFSSEEETFINANGIRYTLKECSNHNERLPQVEFCFNVSDPKEIEELLEKYNFFTYRRPNYPKVEKISHNESSDDAILSIEDIDGRVWKFKYLKKSYLRL